MVDSTRSRHLGNERAARTTELAVQGDSGRKRQQPLGDPHPEVVVRAGAVALEREQVLAGPEDRLDALADRGQVETVVGLVGARRAQHTRLHPLDGERELAAGVALVADDRLAASERARQELERDLALGPLGRCERRCSRGAVGGAGEVQAHPPEEARMALAVAVAGEVGEPRAAHGLARAAALDGRRVEQDDVVAAARALAREDADEPLDRVREPAPALVEAGLVWPVSYTHLRAHETKA